MGKAAISLITDVVINEKHAFRRGIALFLSVFIAMMLVLICSPYYAAASTANAWEEQSSGTYSTFWDIDAVDKDVVWAVGENSTIKLTTDGGSSWKSRTGGLSSSYLNIRVVRAIDAQAAWANCGGANMLRTTNGGTSWEQKAFPDGIGGGEAFDAVSASTAWVAGADGMIMRTDNGGDTWNAQTSGTTNTLYAVGAVDGNTAWIGGDQGTILKTTDGGASWQLQNSGTEYRIEKIRAIDGNTAWVVNGGTLKRTVDGGNTWSDVVCYSSIFRGPIKDLFALDANTAWKISTFTHGTRFMYKTCDGGITWELQYTTNELVGDELNAVTAADGRNAWAAGGDGLIIHTTTGGGKTWYLAEGCTAGGMETWILVQNPSGDPSFVDIDFMTDKGIVGGPQDEEIPPYSRKSFFAGSYVSSFNVSTRITVLEGTVLCERAMYGNNRAWAHDSIATKELSDTWYMAEGSTAGGMETWVLVQNPNDTTVDVAMDFQTDKGEVDGPTKTIPANSRSTFNVGDYVTSYDVSTKVTSTGGKVICERAMYGDNRTWAHDSIGARGPSSTWCLAEGCTAGGMETFILVQNPSDGPVTVNVEFNTGSGPVLPGALQGLEIAPFSRKTIKVNDYVETYDVSTIVDSESEVVCERAMYGNNRAWSHASIGAHSTNSWFLTEGSTNGGMETWVLVQNPGDEPRHVSLSLMTENGKQDPAELQDVVIAPRSRISFPIHKYVQTFDVSVRVLSSAPVICERAMYGNNRTWAHDSIGSTIK